MRLSRAVPLIAVALTTLLAGGCQQAELDQLRSQNLRMDEARKAAIAEAREFEVANSRLAAELADQQSQLQASNQRMALLQDENGRLRATVADLERRATDLMSRPQIIDPVSPGVAILPAQMDAALKDFAGANPELLDYLPEYGMVKLKSDLTFAPGSDTVRPEAEAALKKLVEIINSSAAAGFNVYIAGHTDDMPIARPATRERHPNNWYLSVHRAVAVQEILSKAGVAGQRLGALGFGEYHPIAPNAAGRKGNPLNRRVEIWIVSQDRLLTAGEQ